MKNNYIQNETLLRIEFSYPSIILLIFSLNVNKMEAVSIKKMQIIGKVELIINKQFLLIYSEEPLKSEQVVTVFALFKNEEIKKKYKLDHVGIPKGYISIVLEEEENLYLAEVFQQKKEKRRVLTHPSSFDKITAGAWRGFFESKKEEIIDLAPGEWSGILDKEKSLNFEVKKEITVGDLVGLP